MGGLWQDLRYAARALGKNPASPRSSYLRSHWPSARLRQFSASSTACCSGRCRTTIRTASWPSSRSPRRAGCPGWRTRTSTTFASKAAASRRWRSTAHGVASVSGASQPTRTTVAHVSPDFLQVFGVQPILGRDFAASDATQGAGPTVLVSDRYWSQHLGSPRDLSQSHLKVDGALFSVIGVLPAGFGFPAEVDLWLPADLDGKNPSRTSHNYNAAGRLRDGVTVEHANRDISAIARRIHETSSEQGDYLLKDGVVVPLQDSITGTARSPLLVLLGAVGFLLLVACANVANLLLAQASVRERELAIRSALGAARGRLIRQFLTEAFLLSLAGGGLGVLGALSGVAGLVALAPDNLPRLDSVSIDIPVLVFAFLLSTAVAAGLGAFTAVRATSGDLRKDLVEGGAWASRFAGQPARWPRHRGGADRDHAGARGRSGIVRAQPDESARSESRLPRGQDRHDGRLASVGRRSGGKGRPGDFLFEPD